MAAFVLCSGQMQGNLPSNLIKLYYFHTVSTIFHRTWRKTQYNKQSFQRKIIVKENKEYEERKKGGNIKA